MKLIKINTDHYIIVDDSEIKEGDYYFFTWGGEQEIQRFSKEQYADRENHKHLYTNACKKITHSNIGHLYQDSILPLSLQEVKELIGEVDAEKKANVRYDRKNSKYDEDKNLLCGGFIDGYNQALEDNKDKKWTDEDLMKAIEFGYQLRCNNRPINSGHNWVKDFIAQSLQPKTEWDVDIINGKLTLKQ